MPDDYTDVVIVDAFDGVSVPGELVTVECFTEIARVRDVATGRSVIARQLLPYARRIPELSGNQLSLREIESRNDRQRTWLMARLRQAAPQTLAVPS